MNKLLSVSVLTFSLVACGGDETSKSVEGKKSKGSSEQVKVVEVSHSKLSKFMSGSSICDILSIDSVKDMFQPEAKITQEPYEHKSKHSPFYICKYSWERSDKKEREGIFMNNMMQSMEGKVKKLPIRQTASEFEFTINLQAYKGKPENFMPRKLSEGELKKQISEARKRAADKLTDEQKKIAGNAANSMMENLLRQNNENIKIDGVGDSAYWTALAGGSLEVLSGNLKISISPIIADTIKDDVENAKAIAKAIIK